MWRFILISFGFLGFSFYELSGGSDYAPVEGSRQALAIERGKVDAQRALAAAQSKPQAPTPAPVITAAAAQPKATIVLASAPTISAEKPAATQPSTPVVDLAKATALTAPAETDLSEQSHAKPKYDVREVIGNRVNLRRGPGTNYTAVGKLRQGDRVLVLRDDGEGWLKLRVVETGRIGYMADFLITASN